MKIRKSIPLSFLLLSYLFLTITSCTKEESSFKDKISDFELELRQYKLSGFENDLTPCEAANLTYYIDDCFTGTGYDGAIQAAMNAYNEAPISLFWTQVSDPNEADLTFDCETGNCGTGVASPPIDVEEAYPNVFPEGSVDPNVQTTFPSGGTIGSLIYLATPEWDNCKCDEEELDQCFFMTTVMHEVGHTLGLMHNDLGGFSSLAAEHIPGTPTGADPESIFNSGTYHIFGQEVGFCERPCTFGANDINALQSLYPEVIIDGPLELCVGQDGLYCLSGPNLRTNVEIFWGINGQAQNTNGVFRCFNFSSLDPGQYVITAWIYEPKCNYSVSTTVTVVDPIDCISQIPEEPNDGRR